MAQDNNNKNNNSQSLVGNEKDPKPYSLLLEHIHEDQRKKKKDNNNKNNNSQSLAGDEKDSKPYSLLLEHIHEDQRKKKKGKFFSKNKLFILLFVFIILGVNLVIIYPLFKSGYPEITSTLGKNLSQINLLLENLTSNWNHYWYLGFPWHLFDNPATVYFLVFINFIFGFLDTAQILRFFSGLLYLAVPVGFYFFVRYLSKKEFTALLATLLFSAPPFLLVWIPQVREIFSNFGFIPWQSYIINTQGSAISHLLSLALLPFALIFFLKTLRHFSFKNLLVASIFFATVGFAHSIGLYSLLIISFILLVSETILGSPGQKIKRGAIVYLISAGFLAVWFNIPFLKNSYFYSGFDQVLKNLASLVPLAFVVIPILATALFLIFDRKPKLQVLFVALVWVLIFFFILSAWFFWQKKIVPAPIMFTMEFWMGLSMLISYLVSLLILGVRRFVFAKLSAERVNIALVGLIVIIISFTVGLATWHFRKANDYLEPVSKQEIENSEVYQVSAWLEQNVSDNERVFVTGDLSRWLNYFFLVPQVKGDTGIGAVNELWQKASKEIEEGDEFKKTEEYLRILGIKYIVVKDSPKGEAERENWDFYYPEKFDDTEILVLEENIGPYRIYKVKLNFQVLAARVDNLAYQDLQKGIFEDKLADLADILDSQNNGIVYQRDESNKIILEASLEKDQGLVVKENYYHTWQAQIKERKVEITKDSLGFIYLKPNVSGQQKIILRASGNYHQYIGYAVALFTVWLIIFFRTKKIKSLVTKYQALPLPKGQAEKSLKEKSFVDMMTNREAELEKLSEKSKAHYQATQEYDWVEGSDNFASLTAYFHRNREALTKKLLEKFGFGDKYLDAGCGTGFLLRHMPKGSIGLDINSQNISLAKKNVPEAALVVADIENIPFPSNMFSTVVCTEVLDRLPHPKKVIKEILRVLKPGGVLIGTVPRQNPLWRLRFLSSSVTPEPFRFEYSRKNLEQLLGPFEKIMISPALSYMTWAFVVKKKSSFI